jgi:hypothetical protein
MMNDLSMPVNAEGKYGNEGPTGRYGDPLTTKYLYPFLKVQDILSIVSTGNSIPYAILSVYRTH